jgi:hypothetical protein
MATPSQIIAALSIENTTNILYPTAPKNYSSFEDITDWAGLGYSTGAGDTVEGIFQVVDPTGQVVYENAGFAGNDFTSPDWDLTDLVVANYNLLTYTGTDTPIYGDYTVNLKVQVTPNGLSAIDVEKSITYELNANLKPTQSLELTYDCNQATFTSTDTTVYGAPSGTTLQTITRTHITRPPLTSKRSDGTTAQSTVTSSSQTNYLTATNNPLWTGSYDSSISAILTYKKGNDYTIVNVSAYEKSISVVCDTSLCTLFCYLKKLYNTYVDFKDAGNSVEANMALVKWQKGTDLFVLISKAMTCATNEVEMLTDAFYKATGMTQGCGCGCDGDTSAPVIPTVSINGTNGTNGLTPEFRMSGTLLQWKYTTDAGWTTLFDFDTIAGLDGTSFLQGSGVPSSGLGENGDSYLNIANGDIYLKSAGTWSVTGNVKGASGVSLLHNDISNTTTSTNALEMLKPFAMSAGQLAADGDMIEVYSRFTTNAEVGGTLKEVYVYLGGAAILGWASIGGTQTYCEINLSITRTSATAGKAFGTIKIGSVQFTIDLVDTEIIAPVSAVSATWANALNIETKADDNGGNAITNTAFQVTYFKKQ